MLTAFQTDTGKVRPHNEDSGGIFEGDGGFLAVVADGMGGHKAGDIASFMAIDHLKKSWERVTRELLPKEAEQWLKETIEEVNHLIYKRANDDENCSGMGTTLVAAVCTSSYIVTAHIGDSRIYLLNETTFSQKTHDHTLVNELVKNGQLSEDEAATHPNKHVLVRALGTDETIHLDFHTLNWESGDVLCLCTDGLTNKVSDERLEMSLRSDHELTQTAHHLIRLANDAGGEDNISIALLKNEASDIEGDQP